MTSTELWAVIALLLFLKMFAVVCVQSWYRVRYKVFVREEDAHYWGDGKPAEADHPRAHRAQAVLRNDSENIPSFLFLTWAHVVVVDSPHVLAAISFPFVLARALHAWWYIRPRQPHRNRAYVLGLVSLLTCATHVAVTLTRRWM